MSFHPNDIARRTRLTSYALGVGFVLLLSAFFRAQVLQNASYLKQSQDNRLRTIPLPAPRGIIYDRKGQIIAENLPAYSVSLTAPSLDSLRGSLKQLQSTLPVFFRMGKALTVPISLWRLCNSRKNCLCGVLSRKC